MSNQDKDTSAADKGIDPYVLCIKISREAQDWDTMADQVKAYLKDTKAERLARRDQEQSKLRTKALLEK